ncbi:MAG: hypothetical protein NT041_01195 [Candidatus Vogelbacteria bacterium]|nr:hypothetical protein [Candidatus Vogelbacteria bacterium]
MKKFSLILIIVLLAIPALALAKETNSVTSYSKAMSTRLTFGLNRNATLYNKLVEQSVKLTKDGKSLSEVNVKLAETKLIIDRGQANLTLLSTKSLNLTATSTPKENHKTIKQLVGEIIRDIRQSYVKIKEIKLLIKNIK